MKLRCLYIVGAFMLTQSQLESKLSYIYILNMKHHLITQKGQNVNQSFCTGKKTFKKCFIWMHILKFEVPKRLLSMCKTFLLLVYKVWGINFTFRSLFTTVVNQVTKIFLDLISACFPIQPWLGERTRKRTIFLFPFCKHFKIPLSILLSKVSAHY